MPTITIDDNPVEVPSGATVLDAARRLGIEIPTLCFLEGYKASTSCQVCLVKISGTSRFVPSCGTQVVDGMQIDSETAEVHRIRRTALELLFSDHVGDCLAPCFFACPAHMDVPHMLRQIGEEDLHGAIATIKEDIALPAILGRVCPKPCEKGCRRAGADGPVEVCDLKRYVADRDLVSRTPYVPACRPDTGKRVAVVGAGPTGLAAAFHLRRDGHAVTIFESEPQAGGRLWHEFSAEQLPRTTLEAETQAVLAVGIELRSKTHVGNDVSLDDLTKSFDAVLLACGGKAKQQAGDWGLTAGSRGIDIKARTFETSRKKVFAAGNATRGSSMVVRSVADGKEAAAVIGQFLSGKPITPAARPFSSKVGKISPEEMPEFLAIGADAPRCEERDFNVDVFSAHDASQQANRCLACGCAAHGDCSLERYAAMYDVDATKYSEGRRAFVQVNRGGSVIYEPGKCINCEICVQIAAESGESLGLSFVGRGFDVRIGVPFGGTIEQALGDLASRCISACPTGALYLAPMQSLIQLEPLG
jgi:NADPH-dependent glutamate synthase beta subunit-like oxidoreductase